MTEKDRRKFLKAAGVTLAGAVGVLTGISAGGNITRAEIIQRLGAIRERRTSVLRPNPPKTAAAEPPKGTTRKELVERLQKLAESKSPMDLNPGAMCYVMVPPKEEKKPCPKCGLTMKVGEKEELLNKYDVPLNRLQSLGLNAKLILPEHCPDCGLGLAGCGQSQFWEEKYEKLKDMSEEERKAEYDRSKKESDARRFLLEIKYPDHPTPVRVALNHYTDLEYMVLFLQGKDRIVWGNDGETAIKDKIDRLRELFGIPEQE